MSVTPGRDRPNLLLIVSDQQRPDMVGAFGRVPVRTPALDRLCAEGTAFTRAYVACPLCTPSRATLLTGQYPSRHGAWSVGVDTPPDALSLPRLLREGAGYHTAIIGKSHFTSVRRAGGFEALPHSRDWEFFARWSGPWYGFDHARIGIGHTFEEHAYAMHYGLWLRERGVPPKLPFFETATERIGRGSGGVPCALPEPWQLPEDCHSSAWVADETIAYIRERHAAEPDRPWYACVNFPDPHPPFAVPAPWHGQHTDAALPPPARADGEWADKPTLYRATVEGRLAALGWHDHALPPNQRAALVSAHARTTEETACWHAHMDMMSLMDHHIGRILDMLDALDLAGNTLVVFTSDHGDYLGDHFLWGKGGSHYDAAVRVPFLVRWPGRVPAGARSEALQSLADVAPTLLTAAGLPPHSAMQGRDQLSCWREPGQPVRRGVLVEQRVERGLTVNSWITDMHRLSVHSVLAEERDEWELYDRRDDPHELVNRAAHDPAAVTALMAELLRERAAISGPWAERLTYS